MKQLQNTGYLLGYGLLLLILSFSCSTKKNSFMNRTGHAMSTKFNVLFNGNEAFVEAKQELDANYEDNYWERLPIEPLKIEEDLIPMPGQAEDTDKEATGFEKAEEKAVKSIQKHSMVIDGEEKNNQIDEAYLLLGKSRYYQQRFVPALEAFSFGIENYADANLYYETLIWKAKAHIRLQNEKMAIQTLKIVLRNALISDEEFEKAHTAMAMAYTQLDSTHLVLDHLKKSTYYFTDQEQGARNLFIQGQIYREQQHIDSSNMVFESLSYMKKIPRKYKVHAALELAKNYSAADSTSMIEYTLRELIKDRDNRPYLDELYYQAGLVALKKDNRREAKGLFELSLIHNTKKPVQKSLSYEVLGEFYFDEAMYKMAGAYYDSVLQIPIDQNTRRIRRLIKKRESLTDVIAYEATARTTDSILSLTKMTSEDQRLYFVAYVDRLKADYEAQKQLEEQQQSNMGFGDLASNSNNFTPDGSFYFYNAQVVGMGKQQFQNRYGNRALGDFWILSNVQGNRTDVKTVETTSAIDTSLLFSVDYYVSKIPKEPKILDSLHVAQNDAYYNLGLIYKERFKEYELAAIDFEKFLNNDPPANLILPAKYQLYKIYEEIDPVLGNKYKDEIVTNYPDSRYAEMITNPQSALDDSLDQNSPETAYRMAYICYEEEDFGYSLRTVNEALARFKGHELEAKFELLKGYLLLKTNGQRAFEKKLEEIILNFPNTEESKHAEVALEKLKGLDDQNRPE